MNFQTIVVIVLIILLIIILTIIGVTLKKGNTSSTQRIIPACPDFWTLDPSSNKCVDIRDLGTCSPGPDQKHLTMDFNSAPFVGTDGNCQKYNWATKCGVSWENITYGISKSPCDSSSSTTT